MIENNRETDTEQLAGAAIAGIRAKKGFSIVKMDLSGIENSVCNNFIICNGNSSTQVQALAESVEEMVQTEIGQKPWHKEGYQNAEWILLDYVNVVVHIFNEETRKFYNLEGLWADAEVELMND